MSITKKQYYTKKIVTFYSFEIYIKDAQVSTKYFSTGEAFFR